jgi:hypothetical protein
MAVHYVTLRQGASNTTPWGKKDRRNVRRMVSDPEQLRYYQQNTRYIVTEAGAAPTRRGRPVPPSARPRRGPPSGNDRPEATPDRVGALAKREVSERERKRTLLEVAEDLGATYDPTMNKRTLVARIRERQAEILAGLEKLEANPDGESDIPEVPGEDDPAFGGGDGPE